jgi:hypothetical protein
MSLVGGEEESSAAQHQHEGYKRERDPTSVARSSAAVAESTEKNVTGTSNRAVTCQYMSRYRVRFQPRRLGEPGDGGQDAPQYGDTPGWRTACASS